MQVQFTYSIWKSACESAYAIKYLLLRNLMKRHQKCQKLMNVTKPSIPYLHIAFPLSSIKHLSHKKHSLELKGKTNQQKGNLMLQRAIPYSLWTLDKWEMYIQWRIAIGWIYLLTSHSVTALKYFCSDGIKNADMRHLNYYPSGLGAYQSTTWLLVFSVLNKPKGNSNILISMKGHILSQYINLMEFFWHRLSEALDHYF